jgi:hypothetical protein
LRATGGGASRQVADERGGEPEVGRNPRGFSTGLGKGRLFPAKWATQKALAESDMVRWLTFPTELGRAPDEIELMKVVSKNFGPPDGVLEWYLFRFRTNPPHWSAKDGWMSGVAGPFKKSESPSTTAYGDTFSTFTRWDSLTPEQHVEDVRKLLADWRKSKE